MKTRTSKTVEYLQQCKNAIDVYSSEMKSDRERNENMQLQILEEYKNIRTIHENFVKCAKEQWNIVNAQREEKIEILREIKKRLEAPIYNIV